MELRSLIKEVVKGFLEKKGDLTDLIADVSKRESLNEHMIRRVCEGANTETRLHFYRQPNINQASALFPVADAESIINMLFPEVAQGPSSSVDYMQPPPSATVKVIEISSPEKVEKKASLSSPTEGRRAEIEKQARTYLAYEKFKELREDFFKEARQYLLNHKTPEDINKMANFVDGQDTLKAVFPTMEEYLAYYNLHKSASNIKDYLNKDLKVTYVIGDNPLVVKYKTLCDKVQTVRDQLSGEIHHQELK